MHSQTHLVFVYNANSGLAADLLGGIQKLVAPDSYQCRLCQLSYGVIQPKAEWQEFLATLDHPVDFLHRDEFQKACPHLRTDLPAVFLRSDTVWQELVSARAINACRTTDELIALIETRLERVQKKEVHG